LPQSAIEIGSREQLDYLCAWQKAAYDAGLVGCDYPREYGGGGRDRCQLIANQLMQAAEGPVLMAYTEEVRAFRDDLEKQLEADIKTVTSKHGPSN